MKAAIPLAPEIHRTLAIRASEEGVSVETLTNALLDFGLGEMASGTIRPAGRVECGSIHHAPPGLNGMDEFSTPGFIDANSPSPG